MVVFLVFWKSPNPGFGDDVIYVAGGERLLQGDVLYSEGFRGGPFGALVMFIASKVLYPDISWAIFQLIYIACVSGIVFLLTQHYPVKYRLLVSIFAISSAHGIPSLPTPINPIFIWLSLNKLIYSCEYINAGLISQFVFGPLN